MAQRKPMPRPSSKDLAIADRVMRARRANPPRDPTGEHHETLADLAQSVGVEVHDLIDDWDHAAAIREYDGNVTRAEAERLACEDICSRYRRQGALL